MFIHPMRNPEMNNSNTRPALLFVWFDITRVWFGLIECISSRFATRTARTQGIGWRGKKRAYLAQPKADWGQTWPSLALTWAEQERTWAQLGRNLRRTRATWLQLGPNLGLASTWRNLGTFRHKLGLACATGASGAEVGHKTSPMWATWPRTNPEIAVKMRAFSVAHWVGKIGSGWAQLGPRLPQRTPTWPNLGPSCVKLAKIGHVGLKLGPKQHRWIPNWSHVMRMEIQVSSNMPQLGTLGNSFTPSWGQWRHNIGIDSKKKWKIPMKTGPFLMPYGPPLGAKLLPNGRKRPSRAILEPSWAEVGANWSKLGRSWALAAQSWPQVGPMLRPCWIETVHLGDFGPICKMCKLPVPFTFWRSAPFESARPQMKLYQSDRSVRSHALLNYHASAPSVRADLILGRRDCQEAGKLIDLYDSQGFNMCSYSSIPFFNPISWNLGLQILRWAMELPA